MSDFDLIPTSLFWQAVSLADKALNAQPPAADSVIAVSALVTVLVSLPVLLRLVYKQAKTGAQTTEDAEAAVRHFLPY